MSTKQPKPSRWVTRAGMTSPAVSERMYCSRHSCCAALRERTGQRLPSLCCPMLSMRKQTGLPTRESKAMSRTEPSAIPKAPSHRGMMPRQNPKSTTRSCCWVHKSARASRMVRVWNASQSPAGLRQRLRLAVVSISQPSGKKFVIFSSLLLSGTWVRTVFI